MLPDPGTTIARLTLSATFLPLTTFAAARRSSIREFVHDPINTLSMTMSSIFMPAVNPIYCKAFFALAFLSLSSKSSGPGTTPVIGTTSSGDVPHEDRRRDILRVDEHLIVVLCSIVTPQTHPVVHRLLPLQRVHLRRQRPPLEILHRRLIRRNHPRSCPSLDRHVAKSTSGPPCSTP